jgi:hypothetical protein
MRLREFGEIRKGNCVIVACLGLRSDGEPHCCGTIRIPFTPTIGGAPLLQASTHFLRVSGETIDDLTLRQSVNAGDCGHFNITDGDIHMHPR